MCMKELTLNSRKVLLAIGVQTYTIVVKGRILQHKRPILVQFLHTSSLLQNGPMHKRLIAVMSP